MPKGSVITHDCPRWIEGTKDAGESCDVINARRSEEEQPNEGD